MAKKLATFNVRQDFSATSAVTKLFRTFPKFKGYWKILEFIAGLLPASQVSFDADVTLEGRSFRVPVDMRDPYQIDIFAKNKEELCVPALFLRLIENGGFYLDVGANAGWYCRFMCLAVGQTGIVVGLEPSARAFKHLSKLRYGNFIPLPFAATEVNGQILRDDSSPLRQSTSSTFVPPAANETGITNRSGFALGRSLDHLLAEFRSRPDILKIDVEGAELPVLRGGIKSLSEINYVLVEVNADDQCAKFGYQFMDIYELMKSLGFGFRYDVRNSENAIYKLDDDGLVPGDILFSRKKVCE